MNIPPIQNWPGSPDFYKLTPHNPNLPCKRENVKIKLYQTLQDYFDIDHLDFAMVVALYVEVLHVGPVFALRRTGAQCSHRRCLRKPQRLTLTVPGEIVPLVAVVGVFAHSSSHTSGKIFSVA